jgi:phospholipid transport system substrate-binding protein
MLLGASAPFDNKAAAESADELQTRIAEINDRIIARLAAARETDALDSAAALAIIQEHASPLFDFAGITRRAMGKNWRRADDAQRAKLTELFRGLLEKTYAKTLSLFDGQKVAVIGAQIKPDNKAARVSLAVSKSGAKTRIDYTFSNSADGEWKIVDVHVEKISLLANYRRQFTSAVRKKGVDGLIADLETLLAGG